MTKAKTTKRALLTSVLSMMLCMAMLVGSTFAWFTDSVTSGKNRIVAGNLDVELYYNNASTNGWADASAASVAAPNFFVDKEGNDILWEPGVMAVTQFKVANIGSLALKYSLATLKAGFNSLAGHDLSEVIRFAVIDNEDYTSDSSREQILALNPRFGDFTEFKAEGHLLPVEKATDDEPSEKIFTVVAYWEPNVKDDNLYNVNNDQLTNDDAKQLYINIEINLTATQYTYEKDSFDDQYDRVAALIQDGYADVNTSEELAAALTEGKNVVLTEDIKVTNSVLKAAEGTVIDGNGNKLIGLATDNEHQGLQLAKNVEYRNIEFALEKGWGVITKSAKFINCTFDAASPYLTPTVGGDIVVDGCTFINTLLQICYNEGEHVDPATINTTITNNKFIVNNTDNRAHAIVIGGGSPEFWANGAETVTMTGNTFTPNNSGTSYIAYFIYGDYGTTLTSVPVYGDNTFNGNVYYSINSTAVGNQKLLSSTVADGVVKTAEGKYQVISKNGLLNLASVLATDSHNEGRVVTVDLMTDIDMTGVNWTAISDMWTVFNGNNHTISNLHSEGWRAGLFGYAGAVTINDLTLENVTSIGAQAGIFAGSGEGLQINNCYLKGTNTVTYKEYKTETYTEEWGGIGAITGLLIPNSNVNVEIVEGATVTLDKSTLSKTEAEYIDLLTGYFGANKGTITNNGTVSVID